MSGGENTFVHEYLSTHVLELLHLHCVKKNPVKIERELPHLRDEFKG